MPSHIDSAVPEQRIAEAAHHLGPHTAVTGWASLRWQGATWFDGTYGGHEARPVDLATLRNSVTPQLGSEVISECIPPRQRIVVDGLNVVKPVAAVAFEMRYATNLIAAVRAFDMAAMYDLVSADELLDHLEMLYHWTGIPLARTAAALVDENAWSPTEVDSRLLWPLELGLEPPLANRPVFDRRGRHIGTPDLVDTEAGLAVDYNGRSHLESSQRARDLKREDDFRGVGLEYLCLVAPDIADRRRGAARVQAARSRAPFTVSTDRAWTLSPPPRWTSTHTVVARRALTKSQRQRLLGYRDAG